jgi:hypothetical protein
LVAFGPEYKCQPLRIGLPHRSHVDWTGVIS